MTATGDESVPTGQPVIERASASDRAFLAMDSGAVPEQLGVLLLLDPDAGLDAERARRLLAERVPMVPRLRQRLVPAPFGAGGPIWVDEPGFQIGHHVRTMRCPEPEDERTLLDSALSAVMSPLPHAEPLWAMVLVTGRTGTVIGLVIVLHHALADGIGGLAVLTRLVDPPATLPQTAFPRPAPHRAALLRQAWLDRLRALRNASRSWRLLRASWSASGGLRPRPAASCSLNQRTGTHWRAAAVHADLAAVQAAAHRNQATVNDAVLVAVAGALHRILQAKGENVDAFVMTVPVSGRSPNRADTLGNMVSPMLVSVPTSGPLADRLQHVAAQVRAHKADASGPPPIAVLGWLFRPLAMLGGFRWYMNRQHRFHTLVSYVRGPAERVTFGGTTVTDAIPVSVGPGGNITVYFEVLSYAGTLIVTALGDPDHGPDLDALVDALHSKLTGTGRT